MDNNYTPMTGPSETIMKKKKISVSDLTTLGKWNRSTYDG